MPSVRLSGGRLWPLPIAMLLVILSAATYGVHNSPARYLAVRSGLTPEMTPPEDLRHWQRSLSGLTYFGAGAGTEVHLAARHGRGVAVVQAAVAVPEGADGLRVELNIGAEDLKPGAESWQTARLRILSFDSAGHFLWYWPKDLIVISADRPFGPMTAVLPLREDLKGVVVRIYNGADSGILRIGPPKIVPAVERPVFAFLRGGLLWAWAAAGLWAAWAAARRASSLPRAGILFGAAALVLAGTLAPQPAFRITTEPIETLVRAAAETLIRPQPRPAASTPSATGDGAEAKGRDEDSAELRASEPAAPGPARVVAPPPPDYPFSFKQAGHFSMFLVLGIACFVAFPRTSWYGRTLWLASFAVTTESLQWFVVTRSSSVNDLVADMAGLALAAAVTAVISWVMVAVKARNRDRAFPGAWP